MTRTHKLEYYLAAMESNLGKSSRTVANGLIDKSASGTKDKPDSQINDAEALKERARDNVLTCVENIYSSWRDVTFNSGEEVGQLVNLIAVGLNEGILAAGKSPYRSHEINNPRYSVPVSEIEPSMNLFNAWAVNVYNADLSPEDVVGNGALIEKIIDTDIHPLADGCGRMSKLLSMFLAIKNDVPVKVYPDRKSYHVAMEKKRSGVEMFDFDSAKGIVRLYKSQPDFNL
jgi:hypothetical protein